MVDAFDGNVVLLKFVVGFFDVFVGTYGRTHFVVEVLVFVEEVDDVDAEVLHAGTVVEAVDEIVAAVDIDDYG